MPGSILSALNHAKRREEKGFHRETYIVHPQLGKPKNNLGFTKGRWCDSSATSFLTTKGAASSFNIPPAALPSPFLRTQQPIAAAPPQANSTPPRAQTRHKRKLRKAKIFSFLFLLSSLGFTVSEL